MANVSPKAQIPAAKPRILVNALRTTRSTLGTRRTGLAKHDAAQQGGSSRRGETMTNASPKAQISGGKAADHSQCVEDNAFHRLHPP